jgi:hypothetical protein
LRKPRQRGAWLIRRCVGELVYAVLAERDGVVPGDPVVIALVLEAP